MTKRTRVKKDSSDPVIKPAVKRKRALNDSTSSITENTQKRVRKIRPKTEPSSLANESTKSKTVINTKVKKETVKAEPLEIENIKPKKKVKSEPSVTKKQSGHRERMFIGGHVSIAGGLDKAPEAATEMGAKAFALFLRNQRTWNCKPMNADVPDKFKKACEVAGISPAMIVPHGSYLLNCGAPKRETLEKSRASLIDELKRCEMLGLVIYNFHPGSTCGEISVDECLDRIAESINMAHRATKYCKTLIENMSCQGNTIGGKFEELRGIIDRVDDKTRMGVCLDTCHAMAAGYDLSTEVGYEKMMDDFEKIIGLEYLQAVHLNDSKGIAGCHLDRHENIGRGKIGVGGFQRLMTDPRFENIPMVLETPVEMGYDKEVKLLYKLCG